MRNDNKAYLKKESNTPQIGIIKCEKETLDQVGTVNPLVCTGPIEGRVNRHFMWAYDKALPTINVLICAALSSLGRYQDQDPDGSMKRYRALLEKLILDHITNMNRELLHFPPETEAFQYGFGAQTALEDYFRTQDDASFSKFKYQLSELCKRLDLKKALEIVNKFDQ